MDLKGTRIKVYNKTILRCRFYLYSYLHVLLLLVNAIRGKLHKSGRRGFSHATCDRIIYIKKHIIS